LKFRGDFAFNAAMRVVGLFLLLSLVEQGTFAAHGENASDPAVTNTRRAGDDKPSVENHAEPDRPRESVRMIVSPPGLRTDSDGPAAAPATAELRRGFRAAMYATRDLERTEKWAENLEAALRANDRNHIRSDEFTLGANFGMSWRVAEVERHEHSSLPENSFRELIIKGALARLKCEAKKQSLGVTDADLVCALNLPIASFTFWKNSNVTRDQDTTVVDPTNWLRL